ncbi:MAG: arylsulfatase [Akkermansiaceae bacterium]|nr:arylsulfatase [Akkermansiaceae bacterium]
MKTHLLLVVASLALTGPTSLDAAPLAGTKPNIILIMPDDMGWGDMGIHGNPLIQTPNLNRLKGESLSFTDFHVSPTCAPTRSAIMSGRHEFRNGVTHTIFERERMSLDTITLPSVLKTAGYSTGIFGKWHLGDEAEYQPDQRGFDEVYIHGGGGIGQTYAGSCGDFPGNTYHDPALLHNGTIVKEKGYCTDLFFAQAVRWIGEQAKAGTPFFTYLTPNAPHAPYISPGPKYDALYEGKEIDGQKLDAGAVAYYSMITNIDENVGMLLGKLKEWGLEENTLVFFLSDNGGTFTKLYSGGFRGGKGTPYHGGTHAPSFWRWPGHITAGAECHALAAHIDLFPTFLELVGIAPTPELQKQWDGRSLVPLLENPNANWSDRTLVTHVGRWPAGQIAQGKYRNYSIRDGRYRLVNNLELYDLQADRGESTNVLDQHPDEVAKLRGDFEAWWEKTEPRFVNEDVRGPKINPLKALYWKQFGGGPDEALLRQMDPEGKFKPASPRKKAKPPAPKNQ